MGFLLMQYEYQRASREVSVHQRAGIRLNNQVTRMTKRVERMQSVFEKAKTRIETNFNQLSNQANMAISAATQAQSDTQFMSYLGGVVIGGVPLSNYVKIGSFTEGDNASLLTALSTAAAQARTVLATLINSVKETEQEKLEIQQDEQLTPLSEKEADLQAEKDLEDTLCEMWKERKEKAKGELPEAIKGGMASYGLKG